MSVFVPTCSYSPSTAYGCIPTDNQYTVPCFMSELRRVTVRYSTRVVLEWPLMSLRIRQPEIQGLLAAVDRFCACCSRINSIKSNTGAKRKWILAPLPDSTSPNTAPQLVRYFIPWLGGHQQSRGFLGKFCVRCRSHRQSPYSLELSTELVCAS